MVRLEGFEPPTLGSVDRCSNPLSYSRMMQGNYPSRRTHPVNTGVSPTKTYAPHYRPVSGVATSETLSAPADEYPDEYPKLRCRLGFHHWKLHLGASKPLSAGLYVIFFSVNTNKAPTQFQSGHPS